MAMHNTETLAKGRLFSSSAQLLAAICSQMSQKFERRLTKSLQFLSRPPKCKVEECLKPGVRFAYILKYHVCVFFDICNSTSMR